MRVARFCPRPPRLAVHARDAPSRRDQLSAPVAHADLDDAAVALCALRDGPLPHLLVALEGGGIVKLEIKHDMSGPPAVRVVPG